MNQNQGLDALFGAPTGGAGPTGPQGPGVLLRYGTLSKFVAQAQVGNHSIGDLFEMHQGDLGGVSITANTTIRDTHPTEGGVVSEDQAPIVGHTYVASIRKEDKGL